MFPSKWQHLALIALALLISACASTPDSNLSDPDWEISGKIGIREPARSTTLLFNWQQQEERYVIHLMNSLGQVELTLIGNTSEARAIRPNGKTYKASTPDALLLQLTGWHFPLAQARFWLQGLPTGTEFQVQHDSEQRLTQFHSDEWQAQLSQYRTVEQSQLPHRLILQHDKDSLRLTLLIKNHAVFTP